MIPRLGDGNLATFTAFTMSSASLENDSPSRGRKFDIADGIGAFLSFRK